MYIYKILLSALQNKNNLLCFQEDLILQEAASTTSLFPCTSMKFSCGK